MKQSERLHTILEKIYELIPEEIWAELADVEQQVAQLEGRVQELEKEKQEQDEHDWTMRQIRAG